jgi:hypothetical protein
MYRTAMEAWSALDAKRSSLLTRTERYAALTVPKVCLPVGFDDKATDQAHDYQSLGSQAVTHLCNKLMLAMFAPSRPFAKLNAGKKAKAELQVAKITLTQLAEILAEGEREAVSLLDNMAQRPKLFQVMRHLVVTGNCLLILLKDSMRVLGLRNYVVKRDIEGRVKHLIIKETLPFDELESDVIAKFRSKFQDDTRVDFYKWIRRDGDGNYRITQWVNGFLIDEPKYKGKWPESELPYLALTWDLADEHDYGTGLVEEYVGDFEATSALSESVVDGAILGTEYRWMVNPNGMTSVEDLNNSSNGDALPGMGTDVTPTQGGNPTAVASAEAVLDRYERRISRGFLMGSAVIRDAERVTSEEVRLTANELETAYGGVYSTLAVSLQKPVAQWLFKQIKLDLKGADLSVTIVTGLDALSRSGDLENFRLAMGDLSAVANTPESLQARVKWNEVGMFIGQGRNVQMGRFLMTDEEFADKQAQASANRVEESTLTEAGTAAVQGQA